MYKKTIREIKRACNCSFYIYDKFKFITNML